METKPKYLKESRRNNFIYTLNQAYSYLDLKKRIKS
jgi:hypothetical protein